MPTTPIFSIITVTYNSAAHFRPMLEALFSQTPGLFEAILVDNASTDDSVAIAREYEHMGLRIVQNTENRGFAGGNNQGAKLARGRILFLLNPDAVLDSGALEEILEQLRRHRKPGIYGLRLLSLDGERLMHYGVFHMDAQAHCLMPYRGRKEKGLYEEVRGVESLSGATMVISRRVWDRLGGFDERFHPAYFEDTDLCFRARRAGFGVYSIPVNVRHHENVSADVKSWFFLHMHHRHRWLFMAIHFPFWRLLLRTVPKELAWLMSWRSKTVRKITVRSMVAVLPVLVRRALGGVG
jgi:GT2 family glycosyltransferase